MIRKANAQAHPIFYLREYPKTEQMAISNSATSNDLFPYSEFLAPLGKVERINSIDLVSHLTGQILYCIFCIYKLEGGYSCTCDGKNNQSEDKQHKYQGFLARQNDRY